MGLGNLNPGCCYCEDLCTIAADSFGSDTLLTTAWDGDTPDFTKASGVVTTAASNVAIAHKTAAPSSTVTAAAKVKGTVNGDQLRVIVAWLDADNYLYGQLEVDAACGELSLWEVVSGTHSQLGTPLPVKCAVLEVFHTLRVCFEDGYESGTLSALLTCSSGVKRRVQSSASSTGTKSGIGTGGLTGTATFDDFRLSHLKDDADFVTCPDCRLPPAPGCLLLETDGENVECEWEQCGNDYIWHLPHPDNAQDCVVEVDFPGGPSGESVRAVFGAMNCDNYLFVQVALGTTGSLTIVRREGGSNTTLSTVAIGNATTGAYTLKVCRLGSGIFVNLIVSSGIIIAGATSHGFGNRVGFGQTLVSSADLVSDFRFHRHRSDDNSECPECQGECSLCAAHLQPFANMVVEIEEVLNDDGTCCPQVGGEYDVMQATALICTWRYTELTSCKFLIPCSSGTLDRDMMLEVRVTLLSSLKWEVRFRFIPFPSGGIDPSCTVMDHAVIYESEEITNTKCRDLPVTLTAVSSTTLNLKEHPTGAVVCVMAFPETVILR